MKVIWRGGGRRLVVVAAVAAIVAYSVAASQSRPVPLSAVKDAASVSPPAPSAGGVQPPAVSMPPLPQPPTVAATAAQLAVSDQVTPGDPPDSPQANPPLAGAAPTTELSVDRHRGR